MPSLVNANFLSRVLRCSHHFFSKGNHYLMKWKPEFFRFTGFSWFHRKISKRHMKELNDRKEKAHEIAAYLRSLDDKDHKDLQ